ncbi:winged helix-turn-helix domain-containing protein [Subdoligranulum variabile]|uniref:Transcriptional regulatory protein, C-terminal domain protein n=1 Tax=Subdoligranulum variabile DSM 15176 TaxID=411471 RepID=D1PIL0_9FIRM|nr:winged helix-turn-helix domain-containing protein [Subdoligranulum variabile]EFB77369.1 transcriptional regulatory protein, C-terminal domain protein [Subdoligranulum variabile DSM 15176]UWP67264.1 winged helix-turn-helix domain-containing protein [Subdoligranulum variabile]
MIHYKDILVDTAAQRVWRQGEEVHMTRTEYRLLLVLLGGSGRVFSREELLYRVWGVTVPLRTRTVDIHIARLRRKLGLRGELRAVMRKGYALKR